MRGNKVWDLLFLVVVPAIKHLMTPILNQPGFVNYFSPMVISFGKNDRFIDLHNGTTFYYLLEMPEANPVIQWKKQLLRFYFLAFCNMAERIQRGELSEPISIRGSSYFLNARTARKIGFTVGSNTCPTKVNITPNYLVTNR